jgi:Ca2+-binding EF-hand superfamily protein
LEKILFEKVRQRTVGTDNEGATLRRKFNFVDTYDEGLVDLKQFKMAMIELGCLFEDKELRKAFPS